MSVGEQLSAIFQAGNPFAADALPGFYFVGGQRRFLLQQAVHGLYIARSIVLVSGERGAGKSHLLRALRAELSGLADCCEITASVLMDGVAVRRELAELCRLPIESADDNDTLIQVLLRQTPTDIEPQPVVLLIDDAHELAVSTLSELQQLVEQARGRLRLLLAGEPTLVTAWQQLPVAAAELLELQPLDLQESADYLQTRLQAAGWRGALPLSEEHVQKLYRGSAGCIGRLNELAPAALVASGGGEATAPAVMARKLPWQWVGAAAAAVLVIGGIASLFDEEPQPPSVASGERKTVALPLSVAQDDLPAIAPPVVEEVSGRVAVAAPLPESAERTGSAGSQEQPMQLPAVVSAPADEPAPTKASKPVTVPVSRPSSKPEAPAAAERPAATIAAKSESASSAAYRFDEQKILGLAPEGFVLQLIGVGSDAALRNFLRTQAASTKTMAFEARRAGKPWFVVVAGPYPDRAAAQAAVASLPASLRAAKPWPRTVISVQADIRAAHGSR